MGERLGLRSIQFTLDLIDPWWPQAERSAMARAAKAAADANGIAMHSAQIGLAGYTYNGLLHPDPAARAIARTGGGARSSWRLGARRGRGGRPARRPQRGRRRRSCPARIARRRAARARSPSRRARRRHGLSGLLVEPTPLPREIPSTVAQSERLLAECADTAVPLQLVIDVGHALYRPLYGEAVTLEEWLRPLASHVGVLHLQNHDFRSDAHWGWPDARGSFDPQQLFAAAAACGLGDVPVFLELFSAFEQADDEVLALAESSVAACR